MTDDPNDEASFGVSPRSRRASFLGAALVLLFWTAPGHAQVETFDYTVEEGDTCESIAEEFYEHDGGCDLIKKYNSEEGKGPEFTPGTVLELPTKVAKAEAKVDRKHGPVRAREPDRPWHSARVGEELFRTWRVNTLEAARAELSFRDRSEMKMRQNTLVLIYGGSRERARRKRTRARLEEGKLRSKLGELSGGQSAELETPSARAEMTGGNIFFDVRASGTTRVANHGGESVDVSGRGAGGAQKTVSVREGMGTKVEKGKPPSPPEKLPPAPAWKTDAPDVLSLGGESVTLTAEWEPVDEAAEYFVELAADRRGIEILKSAYVPADVTRLEVQDVPPGTYYATVSTIDSEEFEGIPSERLELQVVPVDHDPEARLEGDGPATFVVGTRLSTPSTIRCSTAEEGEKRSTVRLGAPGDHRLFCAVDGERAIAPRPIRVATPGVEFGGPGVEDGEVQLQQNGFALVDLSFDPRAPDGLGVTWSVDDEPGLTATATPVTRSQYRLKLAAGETGAQRVELVVRAGEEAELVRIPVEISSNPSAGATDADAAVESGAGRALRLGVHGSGLRRSGAGVRRGRWGGAGRGVLSYLQTPQFGLELLGSGRWLEGGFLAIDGRVRAVGRLAARDWYPYVAGGFGVTAPLGAPASPYLGVSGGIEYRLSQMWSLRGEIGNDLGLASRGAAVWAPRADVGILMRFP